MKCYLRPNIDFVEALIFIIMSKEKICGRHQVDKFKDFIYKDATVFLRRKKDKF